MPITGPDSGCLGAPFKRPDGETETLLVVAVALVDIDGRVLIAKRPAGKALAGLWEFPGHRFACGTLRDQHTSVDIEQCDGGDKNSRQIGHFRRARRHPGSGPVIGIDVDVAVRQIAGPDGG